MNYYFMMDDKAHKSFNFNVTYGRLDFEIQKKPLEEEWSRPFDYIYDPSSSDTIYYNFVNKKDILRKIDFGYDYYETTNGYFISEKLFLVLSEFKIQGCVFKKIKFTIDGKVISSPEFYLLRFNIYTLDNPAPDFVDYDKTELLPSKTNNVVTRKLVLNDNIELDVFKLGKVELLLAFGMVISEEVKRAIEENDCGKGIKFLPIETAQEEYCKNSFKDFTSLIKRAKPKLP